MPVRDVVLYPDPRLKAVCREADGIDPGERRALARDLLDTMDAFPGCVGIAAPQVGVLVRAFAFDVTGHRKAGSQNGRHVVFDPRIAAQQGTVTMREGCLSIPDLTGNVRRAATVTIEGTTLDGAVRFECDAYEARVVLHELDHLDGILFLDRVASAHDVFPRKRYR